MIPSLSTTLVLARNVFKEQIRIRAFQLILIFGGGALYAALLLGALAVDQEIRVLLDFGLGFMELMALIVAIFGAATSILKEIELKTIYLILSRPVTRTEYLLGRYLGLILTVFLSMLAMSLLHLSILFLKGWPWNPLYPLLVLLSYLKICVIAALGTLLAMLSTSILSAISLTFIFWTLGHFLTEVRFLIQKSQGIVVWFLKPLSFLIPNLQIFNLRDRWEAISQMTPLSTLNLSLSYTLLYSSACLFLAQWLLRRKEF
ncbi:MAG: ABC transporter permease [Elusimicrobia bacterium]|nr:ABC transporter permease [Elusimicrobiota bacterium]